MSSKSPRASWTVVALLAFLGCGTPPPPSEPSIDPQNPKPTIVLVHGAFADASSWTAVVQRLQQRGYTVIAPPNPLRGVAPDAAAVAAVLETIAGPIVLVGHSYGGMVISQAAEGHAAVKALVYVAAFVPETGESAGAIINKFPVATFGPDRLRIVPNAVPGGAGSGADAYIKPDAFREVIAADLPASTASAMAATQRPIEASAIGSPLTGTPAWKTIPSWALVARSDHAISPAAERFMYERAHAHVVEVDASHAVAVSHPDDVANLILEAAHSVH
ncbi:MAG TPA: alpha/beta hydrolase [Kofleriaceae bacterium]|nr:alpha/beta hydrolase [Kofleriaceae bacterium]